MDCCTAQRWLRDDRVAVARSSRFFALGIVHFMSNSADMVINDFPQPIRDAEGLVLRQSMPGSEGQIFAKLVLLRRIESLPRDTNRRYLRERCLRLLPLDPRILNIHWVWAACLHQEFHTRIIVL